jgi:hypothetical protein
MATNARPAQKFLRPFLHAPLLRFAVALCAALALKWSPLPADNSTAPAAPVNASNLVIKWPPFGYAGQVISIFIDGHTSARASALDNARVSAKMRLEVIVRSMSERAPYSSAEGIL